MFVQLCIMLEVSEAKHLQQSSQHNCVAQFGTSIKSWNSLTQGLSSSHFIDGNKTQKRLEMTQGVNSLQTGRVTATTEQTTVVFH